MNSSEQARADAKADAATLLSIDRAAREANDRGYFILVALAEGADRVAPAKARSAAHAAFCAVPGLRESEVEAQ